VTEFQQSPSAQEALSIMTQSYDKLGLTELRDDADRVLQKNFPAGANGDTSGGAKKPWWQLW